MLLGRARRYGARDGQRGEKAKNALVEILPAGMEMLVTRATRVDEGWEGRRKKKIQKPRGRMAQCWGVVAEDLLSEFLGTKSVHDECERRMHGRSLILASPRCSTPEDRYFVNTTHIQEETCTD